MQGCAGQQFGGPRQYFLNPFKGKSK